MQRNLTVLILLLVGIAVGMRSFPRPSTYPRLHSSGEHQGPPKPVYDSRAKFEFCSDEIHESLIRQLLAGSPYRRIFLAVHGMEPPPSLMIRLQDTPARPLSACDAPPDPTGAGTPPLDRVKDRKTGESGTLVDLEGPLFIARDEVTVDVVLMRARDWTHYTMRRTPTGWRVAAVSTNVRGPGLPPPVPIR